VRPTLAVLVAITVVVALALPRAGEIRERAEAGLGRGMPAREAELARGFVLGQDEGIDAATKEDFRRSGLSHLLAVSGQNVTLLALLALPLLAALGIPLRERLLWVLALIAVYVPLTGAGPSIQRAAVMGAAGILATLAGRRASRLYALALAAGVTLAIDPSIGADVGWQLSFAAVLGILVWAGPLRDVLGSWLGGGGGRPGARGGGLRGALAEGVAVTVAATVATAPLIAFHFETFSVTTLAANVLALPAVAPAMWLGMAGAAASQIPGFPVEVLNAPNAVLLAYIAQVAAWCAAPDWAEVEIHLGGTGLAAAYAALALGTVAWRTANALRRRRPPRARSRWGIRPPIADSWIRASILAGLALVVCAALVWPGGGEEAGPPGRGLRITVLDVGQGDAILLQPAQAPAVLVDGGPPGDGLAAKLAEAGVRRLGAAVVSHDQSDHRGGIEEMLGTVPVARLLYARLGRDTLASARSAGAATVRVAGGTTIRSGRLRLEFIWPPPALLAEPQPGADPNQLALVAVARWRGFSMLLSADAEAEAVPLDPGPVDVLKVAHHGSDDAGLAALLERTRPELAVISVGEDNSYGHPTAATLVTLAAHGVRTLRTDSDGSIEIDVKGRLVAVEAR
jgi:competence protein ComEC